MSISINWATKVITVPQGDLTYVSPGIYELDVDVLRLALKDIEDSEDGMSFPDTHRHNTQVTLSGVTYARTFEIINGYTVTFPETGTPYTVRCVGANHNIADVKNVNNVSLIIGNSAGLISVDTSGAPAPSAGEVAQAVWQKVLEAGLSAEELLRIMLAGIAGKSEGVGTTQESYLAQDGATPRITTDFDSNGNRVVVAVDGS